MAGKSDFGVYDFINGQRLNTGYPIFVQGKPTYSIFVITPTSTIYSRIDNVISKERTEMLSLLAGATAAIIGLIIFLIKWNSTLDGEVKRRTKELNESNEQLTLLNEQLGEANEQLKVHDKMQKEFINVAAHELRTPIQPILSLTQILRSNTKDIKQHELLDVTIANAKRSCRLSDNILDATRIESQSLKLDKEQFNLNDVITNTLDEIIKIGDVKKEKKMNLIYQHQDILVEADKARITQVMSNLLNNAVKFIKEDGSGGGTITITTEKRENGQKAAVVVTVKDTGTGIAPEILPRLFSKFISKSYQGTGLGLFLSKNIVEAHGGRIWAENNPDGEKGATFYFSLPLRRQMYMIQ